MALGKSDFGLIGLIGGMTGFVTFLNSILAAAVGRFYAVKVGEARVAKSEETGVEECRKYGVVDSLRHPCRACPDWVSGRGVDG